MFMKKWLLVPILVLATSLFSLYGCKSSSPTSPGTGGGGLGTKLPAGVYRMTLAQWTCGLTDTSSTTVELPMCTEFSLDELFEIDCPVTIVNNSFTVDCTSAVTNGGCTYTERVQATGNKVGNIWSVNATINVSNEVPADCSGQAPCLNARVTVEMVADPPAACTYAAPNTVDATIVGGPLAGKTEFQTFGNGSGSGGIFAWSFFGQAGIFLTANQGGIESSNIANLNVNLAEINANSLPATFAVSVVGGGASVSALPSGNVSYFDQSLEGAYFYSTGGSGMITVNEVSESLIAGTINSLTIDGMSSPPGGGLPTAASRSLTGGFYILTNVGPTSKSVHETGWINRILSQ